MNPPKCSDEDYINFLIATPRQVNATEAARVQPEAAKAAAHDAFTRLLHQLEPDADILWSEASSQVSLDKGILVIDDSTLDKPYAKKMDLVVRHWSGKHHKVVSGINLITLLWSDVVCERFSDLRVIVITQASVGLKRRQQLSERQCAFTSPIRFTRSFQLRNY
jgi:predicted house-cleaning NTP pyrophosphatase (Maf/HAM1 superfamily)